MKTKPLPPIETLREVFAYDPDTGVLTWRVTLPNGIQAGEVAGRVLNNTRRQVTLRGEQYMEHRICYALYHEVDPGELQIDHINRNPLDNRICNLRLATPKQNCANREYTNTARPGRVRHDKHVPVTITHSDGSTITFKAVHFAAFALNITHSSMRHYLYRDGRIHRNRTDTGMRISPA